MTPSPAAIILAAGAGVRFGHPKALALESGRTWLELAEESLAAAGFVEIVVVLGAEAEEIRSRARPAGRGPIERKWVDNPEWRTGRTCSIQKGWAAVSPHSTGVLIHQVDFPRVLPSTFRALRAAHAAAEDRGGLIFLPTHGGRRGHPPLIGRELAPEIAALGPDEPLAAIVRRDPARLREVQVEDPGIHQNLNTP